MLGDHVWLTVVGVQSVPTLPGRVEPRPLCRPVRFFHIKFRKTFLYEPCFVQRGTVMLKQEKAFFSKLLPQIWKYYYLEYICALNIYLN